MTNEQVHGALFDLAQITKALIDALPGWHEGENCPVNVSDEWWAKRGKLESLIDRILFDRGIE